MNFRTLLLTAVLVFGGMSFASGQQPDTYLINEIKSYQDSLDQAFQNRDTSPLKEEDFEQFTGLDYFPINLDYYIKAKFIRTPNQPAFDMPTTTSEVETYEKYGELHFSVYGRPVSLDAFQSHELRETEKYKNYIFLPFRDETNGEETYGGGRYLEMWIPAGDSVIIDFNKAYNPYCVYNTKYSCPLVPKQNRMDIPVYAGVKDFTKE
ncbi:DUF1684 domain-containing protein [Gracilimonas sediminicola]|uniref:DUF1684 domain-containing protein n=1 Tax=Gracilimonas sediminicola TaxID=2952158 RepID=UPI0038D4934D